jgi:hypothetical protein
MHRSGIGSAALIASSVIALPAATAGQNSSSRPSVRAAQTGLPADIFGRKDRQLVVKFTYLVQR